MAGPHIHTYMHTLRFAHYRLVDIRSSTSLWRMKRYYFYYYCMLV